MNRNTNTDFEEEVGLGDLASKKHGKGTKLAAKALLVSLCDTFIWHTPLIEKYRQTNKQTSTQRRQQHRQNTHMYT